MSIRKQPLLGLIASLLMVCLSTTSSASAFTYRSYTPGLSANSRTAPAVPVVASIVQTAGVRSYDDSTLATSCKGYLTGDATHPYMGSTGSGVYRISLNGNTADVYCDMTTAGGGWTLVRRLAPTTTTWFPVSDNLGGTAAFGTYSPDPAAAQNNGMAFANVPFSEYRIASGDGARWVRFNKAQLVLGRAAGCGYTATMLDSNYSATPYTGTWCFRPEGTNLEDPWITAQYGTVNATLYGENSWGYAAGWAGGTPPTGGVNVFIR